MQNNICYKIYLYILKLTRKLYHIINYYIFYSIKLSRNLYSKDNDVKNIYN